VRCAIGKAWSVCLTDKKIKEKPREIEAKREERKGKHGGKKRERKGKVKKGSKWKGGSNKNQWEKRIYDDLF